MSNGSKAYRELVKNLEEKQREMRERTKASSGPLSDSAVQETLSRIKTAPVANDDDFIALLRHIQSLEKNLEPSTISMLQIEAALRRFSATRIPEDPGKTIADALSLAMSHMKGGQNDGDKGTQKSRKEEEGADEGGQNRPH